MHGGCPSPYVSSPLNKDFLSLELRGPMRSNLKEHIDKIDKVLSIVEPSKTSNKPC